MYFMIKDENSQQYNNIWQFGKELAIITIKKKINSELIYNEKNLKAVKI